MAEKEIDEENVYEDKAVENQVEDDEISLEEEAFMKGYNKAEKEAKEEEE